MGASRLGGLEGMALGSVGLLIGFGVAALVAAIVRLSLERKVAPGMAVWRDALEELNGVAQPRLL